jgi:hypothetical protein
MVGAIQYLICLIYLMHARYPTVAGVKRIFRSPRRKIAALSGQSRRRRLRSTKRVMPPDDGAMARFCVASQIPGA